MIEVSGLCKRIDGQSILDNISLDINEGEIMVILGASGAGKSIFLQHLIGLIKPDHGKIIINAIDITKLSEKQLLTVRKNIGYLFQEGALYDSMTVYENLAFPLEEHTNYSSKEIANRIENILSRVELQGTEDKYPVQLSGGMKKRAALARAVILGSRILFCDEPTSGLDPIRSQDISDLIKTIARELHCTTVITSHDINNSFRIADRVELIHQGKLIATGTEKELKHSKDPFIKRFVGQ